MYVSIVCCLYCVWAKKNLGQSGQKPMDGFPYALRIKLIKKIIFIALCTAWEKQNPWSFWCVSKNSHCLHSQVAKT